MRTVVARDVAQIAADAPVGVDLGDDVVVEVEFAPLLERGDRGADQFVDRCHALVGQVLVEALDHVVAAERENIPTPARPIMPLHIRPALLAGVAIVERAGPEILRMLREHMVGDNKVRFSDAAETMIDRAGKLCASGQMLLI